MKLFRDNIDDLKPYVPGIQPQEKGFIKLNTNENPYPPSPQVARALRQIEPDNFRLYPDPLSQDLRDKIAEKYGFQPENVIIGNGSDELLSIALRCFVGEGDRVVFPHPSYSLFGVLAQIQGAEIVPVELEEDYSFPERFFRTQAVFKLIASPNSPSGTFYPPDQIDRLVEEAEGVVGVDEAYIDFSEASCLPLAHKYPNLIVFRTFSKSYALAGLRVGYAFAQEEIIAGMLKVKDSYNVNRISALAAQAALEDEEYFRKNLNLIRAEREYLKKELEALGFFVFPSGANFLLAKTPSGQAHDIYERLLARKILIRFFDSPRLKDCLRISTGTHEQMDILLGALRDILSK